MTTTAYPSIDLPFTAMEEGDSFFIPSVDHEKDLIKIRKTALELGIVIRWKLCLYDEMIGYRVWLLRKKRL
jgi:hypothetical protein